MDYVSIHQSLVLLNLRLMKNWCAKTVFVGTLLFVRKWLDIIDNILMQCKYGSSDHFSEDDVRKFQSSVFCIATLTSEMTRARLMQLTDYEQNDERNGADSSPTVPTNSVSLHTACKMLIYFLYLLTVITS